MGIYPQNNFIGFLQIVVFKDNNQMKNITDDFLKKFGDKIRLIRESKNLTLNDIEFRTGIDSSDYNKIEQGKTNITFKTFLKIAKGLEINPSDLIGFEFDIREYIKEG